MSEPVKELRACPFCGKVNPLSNETGYKGNWIVWCIDQDNCNGYVLGNTKQEAIDLWQNAFCWQQSDRDKETIKNLQSELAARIQLSNSWAEAATKANERIAKLEKTLTKIKDAPWVEESVAELAKDALKETGKE